LSGLVALLEQGVDFQQVDRELDLDFPDVDYDNPVL